MAEQSKWLASTEVEAAFTSRAQRRFSLAVALALVTLGPVTEVAAQPAVAPEGSEPTEPPAPPPPPEATDDAEPPAPATPDADAGTSATEAGAEPAATDSTASEEPDAESDDAAEPVADDSVVVDSSASLFEDDVSTAAVAPAAEDAPAAAPVASKFDLSGYLRGDVFIGKVPDESHAEMKAAYGEFALKLRAIGGKRGDAFAEARFRHGLQGAEQRLFTDLREAYVNAYLGPLDLRVGHQIVVWGRADGFNPTNNLTPFDLRVRSPIEDDRRLANTGVRAFLNFEPLRLEGVWMPIYRATEPPAFPVPTFIRDADPRYPDPQIDNGLLAARLHLLLSDIEMSVSFLDGYAPLPGITLTGLAGDVAPPSPPEVFIARRAYRHQVAGFDFSTAFGELFALRGEAAYRRPLDHEDRYDVARPDLQYVLGVDRSFGPVSVIAQYVGRYTFDWEEQPSAVDDERIQLVEEFTEFDPALFDQTAVEIESELAFRNQMLFSQLAEVQHLASLRLEWLTLHDTLSLTMLGLANFTTGEWLAYPKVGYSISDRMSTSVGAEIYAGPDGTLFGFIGETLSAGYAELRYTF
jgi:hypothetical protein